MYLEMINKVKYMKFYADYSRVRKPLAGNKTIQFLLIIKKQSKQDVAKTWIVEFLN
jgi:hypothetical protein